MGWRDGVAGWGGGMRWRDEVAGWAISQVLGGACRA